jgi:probable F420-dependent oxidoreductase
MAPFYCAGGGQAKGGTIPAVKFGMQLPVQAQSTYFVEDWEATAGARELAAVAEACDENGFDYIAVCDHVAIPRANAPSMNTTWYDPVATLSWLAARTTNVRLLSHVFVVAYRHPLQTAKAFSTLDELSGGRAILGVGAGHVEAEFELLGVSFADRGKTTDDALDRIRAAFADEWGAGDFAQRPRPVQQGGPPIWIGGSSPAAIRRAAERGDGWLPQGTLKKDMPAAIARLEQLRASTERASRHEFTVGAIAPFLYVGDPGWDTGKGCLAGEPDRLAGYLREYATMGVDQVQVRFRSRTCDELCDQIRAFAADVMPLLDSDGKG